MGKAHISSRAASSYQRRCQQNKARRTERQCQRQSSQPTYTSPQDGFSQTCASRSSVTSSANSAPITASPLISVDEAKVHIPSKQELQAMAICGTNETFYSDQNNRDAQYYKIENNGHENWVFKDQSGNTKILKGNQWQDLDTDRCGHQVNLGEKEALESFKSREVNLTEASGKEVSEKMNWNNADAYSAGKFLFNEGDASTPIWIRDNNPDDAHIYDHDAGKFVPIEKGSKVYDALVAKYPQEVAPLPPTDEPTTAASAAASTPTGKEADITIRNSTIIDGDISKVRVDYVTAKGEVKYNNLQIYPPYQEGSPATATFTHSDGKTWSATTPNEEAIATEAIRRSGFEESKRNFSSKITSFYQSKKQPVRAPLTLRNGDKQYKGLSQIVLPKTFSSEGKFYSNDEGEIFANTQKGVGRISFTNKGKSSYTSISLPPMNGNPRTKYNHEPTAEQTAVENKYKLHHLSEHLYFNQREVSKIYAYMPSAQDNISAGELKGLLVAYDHSGNMDKEAGVDAIAKRASGLLAGLYADDANTSEAKTTITQLAQNFAIDTESAQTTLDCLKSNFPEKNSELELLQEALDAMNSIALDQ